MKKLSEIGDNEQFRRRDPPFNTRVVSVCDIPAGSKEYEPVHIYTDEERRELVRMVWGEAINAVLQIDDPLRKAADKYFVDWQKEQGL